MVVNRGDKLHVVYRSIYENSTRRHFVGEVIATDGSVCRLKGYVFVYDPKSTMWSRKDDRRTTIIDVAEAGYITNVLDMDVDIDDVEYRYISQKGLVATDGKAFELDINEFGTKS